MEFFSLNIQVFKVSLQLISATCWTVRRKKKDVTAWEACFLTCSLDVTELRFDLNKNSKCKNRAPKFKCNFISNKKSFLNNSNACWKLLIKSKFLLCLGCAWAGGVLAKTPPPYSQQGRSWVFFFASYVCLSKQFCK